MRRNIDLRVRVGELEWPTPIGLASGTCGYGAELEGLVDWSAVGAIFTKGISLAPRRGHPPPRIWETNSGMLNAIGLENVGVEAFVAEKMPFLRQWRQQTGARVFVNLYATSIEDYRLLVRQLEVVPDLDGYEINLSCPNVREGGIEFGRSAEGCGAVTAAVRENTGRFVVVKLSPVAPVREAAQAIESAGADALSTGNTMPAMAIDVHHRVPRLSAGSGGLSGPALRPISVRLTYEAVRAVRLPVIGVGGIGSGLDAAEFLLAGATAVQIGTATFANPNAAGAVRDGLIEYLEEQGERSIDDIIGQLETV